MLLFKNGKVICSGASSEEQIEQGIRKASKLIHEIQPSVKVLDKVAYTVVNLVATANLHQTLDLFKTAMSLDNVEYEPEQFPGAILRITDPKITLLLFKNGKVICAGAKREDLLRQGLEKAQKMVREIKAETKTFEDDFKEEPEKKAKAPAKPVMIKKGLKAARPKAARRPAKISALKKAYKPKKIAKRPVARKAKAFLQKSLLAKKRFGEASQSKALQSGKKKPSAKAA